MSERVSPPNGMPASIVAVILHRPPGADMEWFYKPMALHWSEYTGMYYRIQHDRSVFNVPFEEIVHWAPIPKMATIQEHLPPSLQGERP